MTKPLFVQSSDGARITYDVTGSGPALILLHSASKERGDWQWELKRQNPLLGDFGID